jgi:hypothetical protein
MTFWRPKAASKNELAVPMPPLATLQQALASRWTPGANDAPVVWDVQDDYTSRVSLELVTAEPAPLVKAALAVATEHNVRMSPALAEPLPIRALLRRLRADLESAEK